MERFLNNENSAFYHVTSPEKWIKIQEDKILKANDGKIFVIRSNDVRIISSLAIGQLSFVYNNKELIILKLSQADNDFKQFEIGIDFQSNEPTMPLQNIIYRNDISLSNIQLYQTMKYDIETLTYNGHQFDNFKDSYREFEESFDIIYNINNVPKKLKKIAGLNNYILADC